MKEHVGKVKKINPSDPSTYSKFVDPLPIPAVAKSYNTYDQDVCHPRFSGRTPSGNRIAFQHGPAHPMSKGQNIAPSQCKKLYNIVMQEANHRFHKFFPLTTIWGYNGICPGPTIEVNKDTTIQVKWINNLPKKHLFPVDHTLHGTLDTPDVRTVVHLHGANVADDSDGHPDAWFSRNYATAGWKFTRKIYEYTNHQAGATLWYHDHAVGITRLNVYAGLAGFYLIRD